MLLRLLTPLSRHALRAAPARFRRSASIASPPDLQRGDAFAVLHLLPMLAAYRLLFAELAISRQRY